jgi:hypothetical protein
MVYLRYLKIYLKALLVILLLLMSFCLYSSDENAITLEDLDKIVQKAGSVEKLIGNSTESVAIRNEYYNALAKYYGEVSFPRTSFDAIITQLKSVNEKVPQLGIRLWETTNLGKPFQFESKVSSSGVILKKDAYEKWLSKWKSDLEIQGNPFLSITDLNRRKELIEVTLKNIKEGISNFQADLKGVDKVKKAKLSQDFYQKTLPEFPNLKNLAAYLMCEKIKEGHINDLLNSSDADILLDLFSELKKNGSLNNAEYSAIDSEVHSALVRTIVPNLETPKLEVVDGIPLENELFVVETKKLRSGKFIPIGRSGAVTYEAKPIPRRIHGIFKGILIKECVGGNCSSLNSLSPERWATIALKDTELYHIESRGSYLGFVQYVPVTDGNKKYLSVDFVSSEISKKAVTINPETKEKMITSVYDLWLNQASKNISIEYAGFLVGKSNAINNAGALSRVRSSSSYLLGSVVGDTNVFNHIEPNFANAIINSYPQKGYATKYGGRMIFDGMVQGAGDLTLLRNVFDSDINNPKFIEDLLKGKDEQLKDGILSILAEKKDISDSIRKILIEEFKNDKQAPGIVGKIFEALYNKKNSPTEIELFVQYYNKSPSKSMKLYFLDVFKKNPNYTAVKNLIIHALSSDDRHIVKIALESTVKIENHPLEYFDHLISILKNESLQKNIENILLENLLKIKDPPKQFLEALDKIIDMKNIDNDLSTLILKALENPLLHTKSIDDKLGQIITNQNGISSYLAVNGLAKSNLPIQDRTSFMTDVLKKDKTNQGALLYFERAGVPNQEVRILLLDKINEEGMAEKLFYITNGQDLTGDFSKLKPENQKIIIDDLKKSLKNQDYYGKKNILFLKLTKEVDDQELFLAKIGLIKGFTLHEILAATFDSFPSSMSPTNFEILQEAIKEKTKFNVSLDESILNFLKRSQNVNKVQLLCDLVKNQMYILDTKIKIMNILETLKDPLITNSLIDTYRTSFDYQFQHKIIDAFEKNQNQVTEKFLLEEFNKVNSMMETRLKCLHALSNFKTLSSQTIDSLTKLSNHTPTIQNIINEIKNKHVKKCGGMFGGLFGL